MSSCHDAIVTGSPAIFVTIPAIERCAPTMTVIITDDDHNHHDRCP